MALNMKPGCCCPTGHTCGACSGIPDTLTLSWRFWDQGFYGCTDRTGSTTLTWDSSSASWKGTIVLPSCCVCGFGTGAAESHPVALTCIAGIISIDFSPQSCGWDATGPNAGGTFTCSPFLWTFTGTCVTACDNGLGGSCMVAHGTWTLSA